MASLLLVSPFRPVLSLRVPSGSYSAADRRPVLLCGGSRRTLSFSGGRVPLFGGAVVSSNAPYSASTNISASKAGVLRTLMEPIPSVGLPITNAPVASILRIIIMCLLFSKSFAAHAKSPYLIGDDSDSPPSSAKDNEKPKENPLLLFLKRWKWTVKVSFTVTNRE